MDAFRPAIAAWQRVTPRRTPRQLYRCLHSSPPQHATPLPHPSVPGPPPEAPLPSVSDALDRVARKRKQADLLKQAKEVRAAPSKPSSPLNKRFWKDVSVRESEGGLQVYLDSRPVRTPNKEILTIPRSKHQLAAAIALEWDLLVSAQQALKTYLIPMTSLAARALDIAREDALGNSKVRDDIIRMLMRYLSTDTLLCWAPEHNVNETKRQGMTLRQTQNNVATPIIAHLTTHVWPGVEMKPILEPDSILPISQPDMTKDVVRGWLTGVRAFELAGLERATLASKSLLLAVRLVHQWGEAFAAERESFEASFGLEEAAHAASVEVRWQTGQWGEVEDTHDVEKEDLRRQLGSVVLLVSGDGSV